MTQQPPFDRPIAAIFPHGTTPPIFGCPSCNSDTKQKETSPGVFEQLILHDDDCPEFLAMGGACCGGKH
jgi:hypothetical protein